MKEIEAKLETEFASWFERYVSIANFIFSHYPRPLYVKVLKCINFMCNRRNVQQTVFPIRIFRVSHWDHLDKSQLSRDIA